VCLDMFVRVWTCLYQFMWVVGPFPVFSLHLSPTTTTITTPMPPEPPSRLTAAEKKPSQCNAGPNDAHLGCNMGHTMDKISYTAPVPVYTVPVLTL
jgi:hypothetical protein